MKTHTALIGIGTNLGDRVRHLRTAVDQLMQIAAVKRTSFLYETPPAYITDQPSFLNAACQLETTSTPQALLAELEEIMAKLGRVRDIRYGPRNIDLDILFYDNLICQSDPDNEPELTIPHPLIDERPFVLGPLCDIAPDLVHPVYGRTVRQMWEAFTYESRKSIVPVTPVRDQLWRWGSKTYVMGILNMTPDSFSGDGLVATDNHITSAVAQAAQFAQAGADCLDIGGQSTRPGHSLVTEEEEIQRIVPAIEAIRNVIDLPLSVDTFRANVASAALNAGANFINDVWGLSYDRKIGLVAAEHQVPLILMHNRMVTDYDEQLDIPPGPAYEYGDVIAEVYDEIKQRLELAQNLGIPRWNLIVDPGIGFGKTQKQQLELINELGQIHELGYPLLFGASRKGFIGQLLGDLPPAERVEGTLAVNVLAVDRGADIIRVHDVKEAYRAVQIADAIVRRK